MKFATILHRRPRVVSYSDFMKLRKQLPQEQRKRARMAMRITLLESLYRLERVRHRHKVEDCESLKRLLPPEVLAGWKEERRIGRG